MKTLILRLYGWKVSYGTVNKETPLFNKNGYFVSNHYSSIYHDVNEAWNKQFNKRTQVHIRQIAVTILGFVIGLVLAFKYL